MKTSDKGKDIIKKFEGCRLTAYKPVASEKYYTIGWGHYGADVTANMTISQEKADEFLTLDLEKFERAVSAASRGAGLTLNQNQFDALVSFSYNCGEGNLKKLVSGRTIPEIAEAMLLYNKGADKKVLAGLVERRKLERELFLTGIKTYKPVTPELVSAVLNNKYGTGEPRKTAIEKLGYSYVDVQSKINQVLQYANDIQNTKKLAGDYWDVVMSRVK